MGWLEGTISITGLPPHRGLIVHLCFYEVSGPDDPAPYGGDPPTEAATDCHKVVDQVDLHQESQDPTFEQAFRVEHAPGYFYLQVRAILFRQQGESVLAQVEPFFYARRPVKISAEPEGHVTLPVSWPATPLEELHRYGTIQPRKGAEDGR